MRLSLTLQYTILTPVPSLPLVNLITIESDDAPSITIRRFSSPSIETTSSV